MLSFKNEDDRTFLSKYYKQTFEIKNYNVLIDGESSFDIPVKNKEKAYGKIIEMVRDNDYPTGNLLEII